MLFFLHSAPLRLPFLQMASQNTLHQFRSTRTRIAKPTRPNPPPSPRACTRDFSNYLGHRHPLRIIFVGHNPSSKSWEVAAPYAHPTNKFWRLLRDSQLADPALCNAPAFSQLPEAAGIGFIDLFVESGSDAAVIGKHAAKDPVWRRQFLNRLCNATDGVPPQVLCCVSKVVAKKLLNGWMGDYGPVGVGSDWQLEGCEQSEIWVLPSTSGRAVLSWEQRLAPFKELAEKFRNELPWNHTKAQSDTA